MVVILVHWLIKHGSENEFKARWEKMTVPNGSGLYREILTEIEREPSDPKFHTFSIGDPFYTTFLNVGIWKSLEHFEKAINSYMPQASISGGDGRRKITIELESFEFKLRERVVLKVVKHRGGALPEADLTE